MDKKTIKELIIHNMPPYPVKKAYLTSLYGKGVTGALNDLLDEGKVVRVKRGYYSLSDELLDEYDYTSIEVNTEEQESTTMLMPTETLKILISSFVSQYSVSELVEQRIGNLLKEVNYYTTTVTGSKDATLQEDIEKFHSNINQYKLTDDGKRLLRLLTG